MSVVLGASSYGKSAIRLVKVVKHADRHDLRDLTVDVSLEGDFGPAHVAGDNTDLLATDTMRNTVYALAKDHLTGSPEAFGLALCRRLLAAGPRVARASARLVEHPWARIEAGGRFHPHGFQRAAGGERVATVSVGEEDAVRFGAGIEDLVVLKTTGSGWAGFLHEEYTTLPETDDRIMATAVSASWAYADDPGLDFDALHDGVRETLLAGFDDHYSPSVQHTLFRMGAAVLEAVPAVGSIRLSLPNRHHLLFDLARFGMGNDNEVFQPTEKPYGLIEATVERTA